MSDLYEDKELTCSENNCGKTFVFTAGEQRFYAAPERNFTPPRRCPNCRAMRKAQKDGGASAGPASPTMPPPGQTFVYDEHAGGGRGRGRGGGGGRDDDDRGRRRR